MKCKFLRILAVALICMMLVPACAESTPCATQQDYLNALLDAKAASNQGENTSFTISVSDELYEALNADNMALMHQLEIQAGMVEVHYGNSGANIQYKNSKFLDSAYHADDINGLINALEQGAREGVDPLNFYIVCGQALYERATGDLWQEIHWIGKESCGIRDSKCYTSLLPVIKINSPIYYVGYRILHAVKSGDTSDLTDDERAAMQTAQAWAAEIQPGSTEDVMRQVHDLLCARLTYDDDYTSRDPYSCIGAFLDGTCVCSGYSDACFLLGSLCGLEVRIQCGYVPTDVKLKDLRTNHAWNLVRVDGEWHMVDVTWDDLDSGVVYDYFNLSRSQAPADHTWNWAPDEWNNVAY